MPIVFTIVALMVGTSTLSACRSGQSSAASDCRRYDATAAKRTFDGRVGAVTFRNDSSQAVQVAVYHPDGTGDVELRCAVPAQTVVSLGNGFGNDWGVRASASCTTTLGSAATGGTADSQLPGAMARW